MKKIIITCLLILISFFINCKLSYADEIDITTSSVVDDLASMDMDKLSYLSDIENIFITMSQYYDNDENLRSYLYFNWADDIELIGGVEISTSLMDENYNIVENYKIYDLKVINNEETWVKCEILGLENLDLTTRRYKLNGIGIYIDNGKLEKWLNTEDVFIFNGIDNENLQLFREEVETITITEKEVQFYCYGDPDEWSNFFGYEEDLENGSIYTDAWYVFFNTDKKIDELFEVEVTFVQYDYHFYYLNTRPYIQMSYAFTEDVLNKHCNSGNAYGDGSSIKYEDSKKIVVEPGTDKVVSAEYTGWFSNYKYHYKELDKIVDLRQKQEDLGDGFCFDEQTEKYTWGVWFLSTPRVNNAITSGGVAWCHIDGSGVSDVAILRLKFKTNGLVKNCYAVDTPTDDFTGNATDAEKDWFEKAEKSFEKLIQLIGILLLVIILGFLFPLIKVLFNLIVSIFKILINVLLIPFKLIGSLFKSKR